MSTYARHIFIAARFQVVVMNLRANNSKGPLLLLDVVGLDKETVSQRELKKRATQQELWSLNVATEPGESVPQSVSPSILSLSATQQEAGAQGCGPGHPSRTQIGKEVQEQSEILTKILKVF